jgi:hypothetical protein
MPTAPRTSRRTGPGRPLLAGLLAAGLVAGCAAQSGGGAPAPTPSPSPSPSPSPPSRAARPAGLASRPPAQIARAAVAAFGGANSVMASSRDMELALTRRGAKGWIRQPNGVRVQVIAVDGRVYLRGREFWGRQEHGEALEATFGDRWVDVGGGRRERDSFVTYLSTTGFAKAFLEAMRRKVVFTEARTLTAGGVQVIRLRGGAGTMDVAATGRPYPLAMDPTDGPVLRFSAYDQPVRLRAPAGAVDGGGP